MSDEIVVPGPAGVEPLVVSRHEPTGMVAAGPDPAAPPPLLPPLTAVQRAWVSGMAEAEGVEGLGPRRINWVIWTVWASRRWGTPTAAMLRSLSSAVGRWRDEQGAGR